MTSFPLLTAHTHAYSWEQLCAANANTNGQDFKNGAEIARLAASRQTKRALGNVRPIDKAPGSAVGLPGQFQPTLPALNGSESVIKSYILEDGKTGVVRLYLRLRC